MVRSAKRVSNHEGPALIRDYPSRRPLRGLLRMRSNACDAVELARAQAHAGAEEFLRIDRFAVDAGFIVESRPGRASRRSDFADHLADLPDLADLDVDLGEMAVAGREPIAMVDFDHAAVAAGPSSRHHFAVGGDADGIAGG